jgi:hypothetical protein
MAKDPWNRYQRGKDMALALYQLKAHLEEQKALQDLGTMVSAAENLPTLKLANLQELAAQGAPRDTTVVPTPHTPPSAPAGASDEGGEQTAALAEPAAAMEEIPEFGSFENAETIPPLPPPLSPAPPPPPLAGIPQEWKKLAKSEVNPKWFWRVVAGAGALAVLLIGFIALRARSAATPSVAPDAALEQEVRDRKQALEEGQRLFAAGKYADSLARFRQVLARSPNNQDARKYAQMAENAVKSQQEEQARREREAAVVAAARTALAEGRPDEARQKAEEILAADASNADAQAIRDESNVKIAEAKAAAVAAARKKGVRPKEPLTAKKKDAATAPAGSPARAAAAQPPVQGPAPAAAPGTATMRLAFDSPIPEGHVMVAVNDQILLRKPFAFKKGESRVVAASMTVPSGPASIKAWLSGPNVPSAFATTTAQFSGGDTKTLRLDYSGGKLAVQLQ